MTKDEIIIAIAEACGVYDRWTVMKRGLYYRPNAKGYTSNISEAWIISEEEADKHVYPHDEPVTKHRVPSPNYPEDLNACHEMEKVLPQDLQLKYDETLFAVVNKAEHAVVSTFKVIHATAPQRCEAFLRTIGKWKE